MALNLGNLNWLAVLVCVVVGQAFLTVWFAVVFKEPWAKAYGAADAAQHTKEVPAYTYGIGVACMILLTLGLAITQRAFGVENIVDGVLFGVFIALTLCVATALPGYAFLKRWSAFRLAIGSQVALIVILSTILAVWQ